MQQYLLNAKVFPDERMRKQLEIQLGFLRKSNAAFDAGDVTEAIRMATTIRTLVHNGGKRSRSVALLTHLNVLDDLWFVDSGAYRDEVDYVINKTTEEGWIYGGTPLDGGLIELRATPDGNSRWSPILRENRFYWENPKAKSTLPRRRFSDWWTLPLIEIGEQNFFSRSELILTVAEQDGGAHVDAVLGEKYENYLKETLNCAFKETTGKSNLDIIIPDAIGKPAEASVRQISFEILLTLERFLMSDKGRRYTIDGERLGSITRVAEENYEVKPRHLDLMPLCIAEAADPKDAEIIKNRKAPSPHL